MAIVLPARLAGYHRLECTYLVDTWCLGVKNVIGPKRMSTRELDALKRASLALWRSQGIPLGFAQQMVATLDPDRRT